MLFFVYFSQMFFAFGILVLGFDFIQMSFLYFPGPVDYLMMIFCLMWFVTIYSIVLYLGNDEFDEEKEFGKELEKDDESESQISREPATI